METTMNLEITIRIINTIMKKTFMNLDIKIEVLFDFKEYFYMKKS